VLTSEFPQKRSASLQKTTAWVWAYIQPFVFVGFGWESDNLTSLIDKPIACICGYKRSGLMTDRQCKQLAIMRPIKQFSQIRIIW
jgi:hypothetical protein